MEEDYLEGYYSADKAREARLQHDKAVKENAFKIAAGTEAFQDILEEIKQAACNGKTSLEFLPHSESFYLQKLQNEGLISETDADFTEEESTAYRALRQLGYTVNIISAKDAVGNSSVVLPGMNPMQGGMQIARCRILWG